MSHAENHCGDEANGQSVPRSAPNSGCRTNVCGPNAESSCNQQPNVRDSYEYRKTSVNIDGLRWFDRGLEETNRHNGHCRSSKKKYAGSKKVFKESQDDTQDVESQGQ